MSLTLPDWVPWWVPLVLLLPALLYGLAFLFMPFSVIGLKSRMESIEARLDEIQQDLRMMSTRGPNAGVASVEYDDVYVPVPPPHRVSTRQAVPRQAEWQPPPERQPAPPSSYAAPAAEPMYDDDLPEDRPPPPPHTRPVRRAEPPPMSRQEPRTEPRLNWPR
ncbi:MAG: hypothetical protein WCI94_02165 [Rhodospirillales bacterium]